MTDIIVFWHVKQCSLGCTYLQWAVPIHQTTCHHIPADCNLCIHLDHKFNCHIQITLSTCFNILYVTCKFTRTHLSTYLVIWRRRLNRSSHHKANVAARLTQHCCHLLRAHTSQINFSNLQDVISTLQTIVLCNRIIKLQRIGCPTENRTQTHGKFHSRCKTLTQSVLSCWVQNTASSMT